MSGSWRRGATPPGAWDCAINTTQALPSTCCMLKLCHGCSTPYLLSPTPCALPCRPQEASMVLEQGSGGAGVRRPAHCAPHLPAQDRRPAAGHLGWVGGAVQHGHRFLLLVGGGPVVFLNLRLLVGAADVVLPPAQRLPANPICPPGRAAQLPCSLLHRAQGQPMCGMRRGGALPTVQGGAGLLPAGHAHTPQVPSQVQRS